MKFGYLKALFRRVFPDIAPTYDMSDMRHLEEAIVQDCIWANLKFNSFKREYFDCIEVHYESTCGRVQLLVENPQFKEITNFTLVVQGRWLTHFDLDVDRVVEAIRYEPAD